METGGQLKSFLFAKEFSDVEFLVGSEVIPAHKVVLCARSPVLRTFLHSLPDSDDQKLVELQPPEELCDIPVEVFREFIAYLYRDSVEADKLKVPSGELRDQLNALNAGMLVLIIGDCRAAGSPGYLLRCREAQRNVPAPQVWLHRG